MVAQVMNQKALEAERLFRTGMSMAEIAKRLEVPAGTVRRWKSVYKWSGEQPPNVRKEKTNTNKKTNVRIDTPAEVVSLLNNDELTEQQKLFCLHYSRTFNATRAYQKASGCSYGAAAVEGCRLLKNPKIRDEIQRLKELRYARELLNPEDIFQKYLDIAFSDMTDFVTFGQEEVLVMSEFGPVEITDPETGEKKPLTKMVNVVRSASSDEVDGTIITEVSQGKDGFKIKTADKMKALAWLADHMDLATEEQKARLENLKANTAKLKGEDSEADREDDGFMDALKAEVADTWQE